METLHYTKGSFTADSRDGETTISFGVAHSANDQKPWSVMSHRMGASFWQQASRSYAYRGCAERVLRKIKAEYEARKDYKIVAECSE